MRLVRSFAFLVTLIICATFLSCKNEEDLEDLGDRVAGPTDIATSSDGQHFFVLNSDYTRDYNEGSILVINEAGEKVKAVPTKRMGRFLVVAGNDLLVGFDRQDDDNDVASIELYDITDPTNPVRKKEWFIDHVPFHAVMVDGYDHFAVAGLFGEIYIGTLKEAREESELKYVRDFQRPKRALYIDKNREILYAFTTDINKQELTDIDFEDKMKYVEADDTYIEGSNEVPDDYEDSRRARRQAGTRSEAYQFVLYDIASERSVSADEDGPFPLRTLEDTRENAEDFEVAKSELRWMYFQLRDADGTPDTSAGFTDPNVKSYQTNFWHAEPDPDNENLFYLSKRNPPASRYNTGNNVISVTVKGDGGKVADDGTIPETSSFLSFKRVYGFVGEIDLEDDNKLHYPSDFRVRYINGQKVLLVSHFRDLVYFRADQRRYSIFGKTLDSNFWANELKTTDPADSFFEIAVNPRGVAMACSFYGNAVIRLEVSPGTDITNKQRIN